MDERYFRKEQKESSLLSSKVIVAQVPTNYQTQDTLDVLENLNCCLNSRVISSARSQNDEPLYIDKGICEGLDCFEKVETKVQICAGTFGMIKLFLCNNCAKKFTYKGVVE